MLWATGTTTPPRRSIRFAAASSVSATRSEPFDRELKFRGHLLAGQPLDDALLVQTVQRHQFRHHVRIDDRIGLLGGHGESG